MSLEIVQQAEELLMILTDDECDELARRMRRSQRFGKPDAPTD
jgi:hypothetical protein